MEITKTLKISYPTVTYHSAELFTAVKVTESDIPTNVPPEQKYQYLNQLADSQLIHCFSTEYQQVYQNFVEKYQGQYVSRIISDPLEQQLIQQGRIKTDAKGKFV